MIKANYLVDKKLYRKAFSYYIIAAMTGDPVAMLNAGILADTYKIISDQDVNYENIEEEL
jgi:TPR repeat protein